MRSVSGSLTATGAGESIRIDNKSDDGNFNISLSGFGTATVVLQRSFDRHTVANDAAATWENVTDGSFSADVSKIGYEPEQNVHYRFNCTAYTSGTIAWRIGVGTQR